MAQKVPSIMNGDDRSLKCKFQWLANFMRIVRKHHNKVGYFP